MNRLSGHITAIDAHGSVAIVDVAVGDLQLTATLLGNAGQFAHWHHAQAVDLLFKETEVALAKNLSGMISLRNRMPGTIRNIEWGQVLTRVHLELRQNEALPVWTITSVITTRSAKKLQLAEGDQIEGLVKSNEMSLLASENKGSIA